MALVARNEAKMRRIAQEIGKVTSPTHYLCTYFVGHAYLMRLLMSFIRCLVFNVSYLCLSLN